MYIYMQYNVVLECTRWLNVYGTVYIYMYIFYEGQAKLKRSQALHRTQVSFFVVRFMALQCLGCMYDMALHKSEIWL